MNWRHVDRRWLVIVGVVVKIKKYKLPWFELGSVSTQFHNINIYQFIAQALAIARGRGAHVSFIP